MGGGGEGIGWRAGGGEAIGWRCGGEGKGEALVGDGNGDEISRRRGCGCGEPSSSRRGLRRCSAACRCRFSSAHASWGRERLKAARSDAEWDESDDDDDNDDNDVVDSRKLIRVY